MVDERGRVRRFLFGRPDDTLLDWLFTGVVYVCTATTFFLLGLSIGVML